MRMIVFCVCGFAIGMLLSSVMIIQARTISIQADVASIKQMLKSDAAK